MSRLRFFFLLIFPVALTQIWGQSKVNCKYEGYLNSGYYFKLKNKLEKKNLNSTSLLDRAEVISLKLACYTILNDVEKQRFNEILLNKYSDSLHLMPKDQVVNTINFVVRNLLRTHDYSSARGWIRNFQEMAESGVDTIGLSRLEFILNGIEVNSLSGFNKIAIEACEKVEKDFLKIKASKNDKESVLLFQRYLFVQGLSKYQFGDYKGAIQGFKEYFKIIKECGIEDFEIYYKCLYFKSLSEICLGEGMSAIRNLKTSFYLKGKRRSLVKLDIRAQIAEYYANTNKDLNYLRNRSKYQFATRKLAGSNPIRYRGILLDVLRYQLHDSYEKAYALQIQSSRNEGIHFEANNPWLIPIVKAQYSSAIKTHRYKEASDTLNKFLDLNKKFLGEESPEYSQSKMALASFLLYYSNNLEGAYQILQKDFEEVICDQYDKNQIDMASHWVLYSQYYREIDQFGKSVEVLNKAIDIVEKDSSFKKKILVYENLAESYVLIGKYHEAELLAQKSLDLIKENSFKSKILTSTAYLDLAKFNLNIGKLQEARKNVLKAKKYAKRSNFDSEFALGNTLDEQAKLLIEFSKFNKAESLLNDNIEFKVNLFGSQSKNLLDTYVSLANLQVVEGRYPEAEENIFVALNISKNVYGTSSLKYANVLEIQRRLYMNLGDTKRATENASKIFEIRELRLGKNHIKTADALSDLSISSYYFSGNIYESLKLLNDAIGIYKGNQLTNHPNYSNLITNKAFMLLLEGEKEEPERLLKEAIGILNATVGGKSIKLAESYLVLARLLKSSGKLNLSEDYILKAQSIYSQNFGVKHPSYVRCQSELGKILYSEGKKDDALKVLLYTTKTYLEFTETYFKYLNSNEKLKFWSSIKEDFEFLNFIVVQNEMSQYYKLVFENTLKTKGLLLYNSQKLIRAINNSKSQNLKLKFQSWLSTKEELRNLITQGGDGEDYKNSLVRLEQEIGAQEKELSKLSSEFREGIYHGQLKFKDIQNRLQDQEVVVEMLRVRKFQNEFSDSIIYAALIFDKYSKNIKVVKIEEGEKLETKYINYYRNALKNRFEDKYSYSKFWEKIDFVVSGYKVVYFSPEMVYHQINVNTLKDNHSTFVLDKYLIVNVSNSLDIRASDQIGNYASSTKTALIVANPDFYIGEEGRAVSALEGAEKEGQLVKEALINEGYQVMFVTGKDATKDIVKNINSPSILHLATHGTFQDDGGAKFNSTNIFQSEFIQDPLFKSNLLFARAGDFIEHKSDLGNIGTNPLLSAHEVMDLPLDQTQIVVLSACEMGMGTYSVGEGVYGMKRAFLVAGADAIFTSLFKISDQVTKELMEKFYFNYVTQKMSKERAFLEAQKQIMKLYPDPIYWGTFVLTGGKE